MANENEIIVPDFSKIFASNAQSVQDWIDRDYLTGWGYLGQVPPPYQLFDRLQYLNDTKLKWLYDKTQNIDNDFTKKIAAHNIDVDAHADLLKKYLLTTGGEVTGLVKLADSLITNLKENIPLDDNSGKLAPTAWIQAFVKELSANVEVTTQEDGHFVCSSLGISGLIAQNGYISLGKLFGGLILQWGNFTESANLNDYKTFPIAFNKQAFIGLATNSNYNYYPTETRWAIPVNTKQFLIGVGDIVGEQNERIVAFCIFIGV